VDEAGTTAAIDWAAAWRPLPGEPASGDAFAVVETEGSTLVAAIDGLGHGPEAAAAAETAREAIRECPGYPLPDLFELLHERLKRSRGVVVTLVRVWPGRDELEWAAVGNVEARVLPADLGEPAHAVLSRGGVVGHQMPAIAPGRVAAARGALLVLATDGVDPGFADALDRTRPPAEIARMLLENHGRDSDDALVLVARVGESR
jgi:phosphoserine phosphatase RsbX